jgi:NAD(P)H dehydrogenase (quinone)
MILVTGAGGKTGMAVIKALVVRGATVRALARNPSHAARLQARGVDQIAIGDMTDPHALARVMPGADAIYHICPNVSPHEIAFGRAMIDAAARANVRRFVYHSVLHPQIEAMPHHWAKMRVEEMLFGSKLDFTILQPTAYMQNSIAEWNRMVGEGVFRVPYPIETRLSLVDLDDVAEVAARVLTSGGHCGATYELVGTPATSQIEIAETFARVLRKDIRAVAEPAHTWGERARAAGMDEHQRETLASMFEAYARDGLRGNPNVLGWLLGRPPTSLDAFAARIAAHA